MRRHIVFCCLLLVACSHKTLEQRLLQDVDPAMSWVSTLQFAGEKWLADSVPTAFVRSSVGAAKKELQKATKAIGQSRARNDLRDALQHQFEAASAAAGHLNEAIEENDRRMAAESIARLAAAHAALERMHEQEESR
jgi:hypothetical protein